MRRRVLFVLILALLLLLSGCASYTSEYIDELELKWSDELYDMEEKYNSAAARFSDLSDDLSGQEENLLVMYLYFSGDSSVSYDDAEKAFFALDEFYEGFLRGKYER